MSILSAVGNTSLVELNNLNGNSKLRIFGKLEGSNPGGLIKDRPAYYMPNQFENKNNVLAHYETTGPEIFSQTKGEIDVFIAGMGTEGTLMGVAKYLKERNPWLHFLFI